MSKIKSFTNENPLERMNATGLGQLPLTVATFLEFENWKAQQKADKGESLSQSGTPEWATLQQIADRWQMKRTQAQKYLTAAVATGAVRVALLSDGVTKGYPRYNVPDFDAYAMKQAQKSINGNDRP